MLRAIALGTALTVGGGTVGYAAAMPADAPITWFVSCDMNGHDAPVFGGRAIVSQWGATELIGPAAATYDGAVLAAREFGRVYGGDCEPTHASEVWMIGVGLCDPARQAAGHPRPGNC